MAKFLKALFVVAFTLTISAGAAGARGGGWHGGGWHGGDGYRGGWGWGGFAAGAILGGLLAAPYYYGGYYGGADCYITRRWVINRYAIASGGVSASAIDARTRFSFSDIARGVRHNGMSVIP